MATTSRCQNNGQSCISAKRFIVHTDVYDEFVELFAKEMSALVVGDPMEDGTDVGPLANEQGREDVEALVKDAVDKGARCWSAASARTGDGWWSRRRWSRTSPRRWTCTSRRCSGRWRRSTARPTSRTPSGSPTRPASGSAPTPGPTTPTSRRSSSATSQAGQTFINGMVASFPALPFGGVKASGHGRELAAHGIREFTNIKTVWVGK